MQLRVLGSGTSNGVPVIACQCKVCRSLNPKNKRNRASVYIRTEDNKYILIDIGPEFRLQALKYQVNQIDALLLTHSHADHLHGIDDLRSYSSVCFKRTEANASFFDAVPIPIYTNQGTIKDIENRFSYFFVPPKEGGGHAKVQLIEAKESFNIGKTKITPIPMMHGHLQTLGWLLTEEKNGKPQSIAYLTDCSYISQESIDLIHKNCGQLKVLIIDALRVKEHSTHFNYLQAMETAEKIGAQKVYFTHMTHHDGHEETKKYIKKHLKEFPKLTKKVMPSWDGLLIKI